MRDIAKTDTAGKEEPVELKITTLIENNPDDQGRLLSEHGLSLYIEADGKNILFDTGQTGKFVENAKALHKDLEALDFCMISHGHYDHSGGFRRFMEETVRKPQLFVGEEFFKPKYKTDDGLDYIFNGNSFDEEFIQKNGIRLRKVQEEMLYLTEHVVIFHHFSRHTDYEKRNSRFYIKENDTYLPDDFDDEISLGIITQKGLVVIVGCSHIGVVNILKTISKKMDMPIYALVGGTHLIEADESRTAQTIKAFRQMDIRLLAVSHCTGKEGIRLISEQMKEQFFFNNTGKIIEI